MNITPEDVAEATGDPLTSVAKSINAWGTVWRVDWHQRGEKLSAGLLVSDEYLASATYGEVLAKLDLRHLIIATNRNDHCEIDRLAGYRD